MNLSVTYSDFTPNTSISSSQMDQNFADIVAWANGNIDQDNFDTFTDTVEWVNSGTTSSIFITQTGVLASSTAAVQVESNAAQVSGHGLGYFSLSNVLASIPVLRLNNAGTGAALRIQNTGSGDALQVRDGSNPLLIVDSNAQLKSVGMHSPGAMSNIGLAAATTTDANDSIKIIGANGSALSASNPGYITLPSTTAGRLTVFKITSDVTIKLTGAHWGLDTIGDFADLVLRVYAVNSDGNLRWIVANKGAMTTIVDTNTSTTQSNVNTQAKAIANSSLSSGTWPVQQVGWFLADFDDTGGAAENLWTVQTGSGEIAVGVPAPVVGDLESFTPTGSWSSNVTYEGKRQRRGKYARYEVQATCSGTPTNTSLTINLPAGDRIDQTIFTNRVVGQGVALDDGNNEYDVQVIVSGNSAVAIMYKLASGTYVTTSQLTHNLPFSFGNLDSVRINFEVPLVGRSEQ